MSARTYRAVDPRVSFPALETEILERWKSRRIYERTLEQRKDSPEWVFFEGPPTANGKPGIHHVEARTFKDLFCRFQTMRGHYVHRKAGWDCHGLPVEIAVEKELGITQKREIEERFGIEEFVRRCRESVLRYVDDWERLTDRIGFWLDLHEAYRTMDADYVETVWWILRRIWEEGLLEEDFKVVPYCPRCETSLSSHEQHQPGAYQEVSDPSVYVRFPFDDDPDTALLVWTTTPWTLLSNMAAAVAPDHTYVAVADPDLPGKRLILVEERVEPLLGDGVELLARFKGADLHGRRYRPPFDFVPTTGVAHTVRTGTFVTTDEGTGIVHLAPYGEDDMAVAKRDGLPIVQVIDGTGHVIESGGELAGLWFKDADPRVIRSMKERDLLFRSEVYKHAYPHCWRCGTPLIYYARKDWYIRTSQIRAEMMASNEETNWQPPTIKYGRFGDWLENNVDWSLSRSRYWGTPLPIWRCAKEHATCVGSLAELSELAGRDLSDLDPHRPYVDAITFDCPQCGGESRRVSSVIDAWFDSGSMPFAQWHYPFENEDVFRRRFPADFISEAIDQTRGWFYSLLAVSTLVTGHNSYRNVVCLGLIIDAEGRKMSKSLGNILDPWTVLDAKGADALRWFLITSGSPWVARRTSVEIVEESLRRFLLTLWNTYSFFVTYAALEDFDPARVEIPAAERPEMDRWILAELDDTVRIATEAMEAFDATTAGRRVERFVDDLSNWYVRRSRRRFWRTEGDVDKRSAFRTLWECLVVTSQLIAPFTPFVSEEIYTNLTGEDSVHLSAWPHPHGERADDPLRHRMGLARRLVTLGRAARAEAKVRTRQPLARALVVIPSSERPALESLTAVIAEELNVRRLEPVRALGELVTYSVKPNFRALGPRFGSQVKDVARALASADAAALVERLESSGEATVDFDGEPIVLHPDELDVRVEGREGFSLAQDGPYGVALDLELTDELRAEGAAREVVRAVQDLRKAAGLDVADRIELWLEAGGKLTEALEAHQDYIAGEVLATALHLDSAAPEGTAETELEIDGARVRAALLKFPSS